MFKSGLHILAWGVYWQVSFFSLSPQPKESKLVTKKSTLRPKNVKVKNLNKSKKSVKNSKSKKKARNKVLTIFGTNCNGILGKKDSLLANIQQFQPGVFFLQETKVGRKGQIKIENYEIFEVVPENVPQGGSILTGIHKNLHPVYISGG